MLHWNSHLDLEPFGSQWSPLYGENPGMFLSKILISFRKTWTSWMTWGWVNYQQRFFFFFFFFKVNYSFKFSPQYPAHHRQLSAFLHFQKNNTWYYSSCFPHGNQKMSHKDKGVRYCHLCEDILSPCRVYQATHTPTHTHPYNPNCADDNVHRGYSRARDVMHCWRLFLRELTSQIHPLQSLSLRSFWMPLIVLCHFLLSFHLKRFHREGDARRDKTNCCSPREHRN